MCKSSELNSMTIQLLVGLVSWVSDESGRFVALSNHFIWLVTLINSPKPLSYTDSNIQSQAPLPYESLLRTPYFKIVYLRPFIVEESTLQRVYSKLPTLGQSTEDFLAQSPPLHESTQDLLNGSIINSFTLEKFTQNTFYLG